MYKENLQYALRIIPKAYREFTLDSFQKSDRIKNICLDFVNKYPDNLKNQMHLVFSGTSGIGKTGLSISIYRELFQQSKIESKNFKFITAPELLFAWRKCFENNSAETESQILDKYSDCDLLILDDLGSEKTSDFAIQSLYLLIDRRIRNMKSTIITTNLSLEQIEEKLDARIASRLSGMKIIKINMPDYRKKRGQDYG